MTHQNNKIPDNINFLNRMLGSVKLNHEEFSNP